MFFQVINLEQYFHFIFIQINYFKFLSFYLALNPFQMVIICFIIFNQLIIKFKNFKFNHLLF